MQNLGVWWVEGGPIWCVEKGQERKGRLEGMAARQSGEGHRRQEACQGIFWRLARESEVIR
jgi:hypothetical protein